MVNINLLAIFLLLTWLILSCGGNPQEASIVSDNGTNSCLKMESIILNHNIEKVQITRPLGHTTDTTLFHLADIQHLYGERLFTLANEKFQCKDIDSVIIIEDKTLYIRLNVAGYNYSGPFTQKYVTNYWERGNGYLLNKKLPSFKGKSFGASVVDLDSLIQRSTQTLLHFGWLSCQGCMKEQGEIVKLRKIHPNIQFINITIDPPERLNKYLIDRGNNFELKSPYNKHTASMIKPILLDDKNNIFEHFYLDGLFPVNFLVDQSGTVKKIGALIELFPEDFYAVFKM